MEQCLGYAQTVVWTGLNKLGPDGYGNGPWSLEAGIPFAGAAAYGDAVTLGDDYADGNCAYMNPQLHVSNKGFQCNTEFPFCCDPGLFFLVCLVMCIHHIHTPYTYTIYHIVVIFVV